jgi:hypothetical protein
MASDRSPSENFFGFFVFGSAAARAAML